MPVCIQLVLVRDADFPLGEGGVPILLETNRGIILFHRMIERYTSEEGVAQKERRLEHVRSGQGESDTESVDVYRFLLSRPRSRKTSYNRLIA